MFEQLGPRFMHFECPTSLLDEIKFFNLCSKLNIHQDQEGNSILSKRFFKLNYNQVK